MSTINKGTLFGQVPLEHIRERIQRGEIRDVQSGDHSPETEAEPMDDLRYPEWQEPFRQALLEVNRERLNERLNSMETAIVRRMDAISDNPAHRDECQAIRDALSTIRILKRETA